MMNKNLLAKTPPMGWNSWDCYGPAVTEAQLIAAACYMANNLKQYGYEYVVCDIQWYEPTAKTHDYNDFAPLVMDEYSRLTPAINRFPSAKNGAGFSVIAKKIHALGLKFGIHIMRGIPRQAVNANAKIFGTDKTAADIANVNSVCSWNTDMYGVNDCADGAYEYYLSLFTLYASWGVDFVKVDDICDTKAYPDNPYSAKGEIDLIRRAIDNCGRDMALSLSPGPARLFSRKHLAENANMWRMTDDFWDSYDKLLEAFDYAENWYPYVSEGCWPDLDMLPVGRLRVNDSGKGANELSRLKKREQILMLSLWCIFRSPLFLGGVLEGRSFPLWLVTNGEILAMNKYGSSPRPVKRNKTERVWLSRGRDGCTYLALFNLSNRIKKIEYAFLGKTHFVSAHELWTGKTTNLKKQAVSKLLLPHSAAVFKLTV